MTKGNQQRWAIFLFFITGTCLLLVFSLLWEKFSTPAAQALAGIALGIGVIFVIGALSALYVMRKTAMAAAPLTITVQETALSPTRSIEMSSLTVTSAPSQFLGGIYSFSQRSNSSIVPSLSPDTRKRISNATWASPLPPLTDLKRRGAVDYGKENSTSGSGLSNNSHLFKLDMDALENQTGMESAHTPNESKDSTNVFDSERSSIPHSMGSS